MINFKKARTTFTRLVKNLAHPMLIIGAAFTIVKLSGFTFFGSSTLAVALLSITVFAAQRTLQGFLTHYFLPKNISASNTHHQTQAHINANIISDVKSQTKKEEQTPQNQLGLNIQDAPLPQLPKELLLLILHFLDIKSIARLSSVSKFFQNLTEDDEVWKKIANNLKLVFSPSQIKKQVEVSDYHQDIIEAFGGLHVLASFPKVVIKQS